MERLQATGVRTSGFVHVYMFRVKCDLPVLLNNQKSASFYLIRNGATTLQSFLPCDDEAPNAFKLKEGLNTDSSLCLGHLFSHDLVMSEISVHT